jgi:hypothetical protein
MPPKGSPRKLASEFAHFLGLPDKPRYNTSDIADAVCQVLHPGAHRPGDRRLYRPQLKPYTPFVLHDFGLVAWLFTNRVRDVRHVRQGGGVWRGGL